MSTDNPDPPGRCGRCQAHLETAQAFCSNCDLQSDTPLVVAELVHETPRTAPMTAIAASRWQVLTLLFVVLGPLALPVLRDSPRFSRAAKCGLTILVLAQTALVIWILWYCVSWFMDGLQELIDLANSY